MDFQFASTPYRCLRQAVWGIQEQEQTQEIRLPDDMPDIGRIVGAWGQCILRGKEWRGDHFGVSGGVMVRVLYISAEDGQAKWLETWIPMQFRWAVPEGKQEGTIATKWLIKSVDGRMLSARKMMVRVNAQVLAQAVVPDEVNVYMKPELPADMELLEKTYLVTVAAEAGEKTFQVEDTLTPPGNLPAIESIVNVEACPKVTEQAVLGGKAVFRGDVCFRAIYMGIDGMVHSFDTEVPFSQYTDLDRDYDKDAVVCVMPVVSNLETEMENGQLRAKAGVVVQYLIYRRMPVDTVEDAYSAKRQVNCQFGQMPMPAMLQMQKESVDCSGNLGAMSQQPVAVTVYPTQPAIRGSGQDSSLSMGGTVQALYYDPEGQLYMESGEISGQLPLPVGEDAELYAFGLGAELPRLRWEGDNTVVEQKMDAHITALASAPMETVSQLSMSDLQAADPARPSLILRRAQEGGLWELAKTSGSTVADIRRANGLEQEPAPGQMLLIPVQ